MSVQNKPLQNSLFGSRKDQTKRYKESLLKEVAPASRRGEAGQWNVSETSSIPLLATETLPQKVEEASAGRDGTRR